MSFWEDLRQQLDAAGVTVDLVRAARRQFLAVDPQEPPTVREEIFRMRVLAAIRRSLDDHKCIVTPGSKDKTPCDNLICAAWRGVGEKENP